jgi:hypothetical protein
MTEDKVAARSGIVSAMLRRNAPDFGDRFGDGIAHVRDAALRLGVDVLGPLLAGVSPDCLATPETLADVALWWLFSSRSPYAVARLADRHLARIAHLARVTPPAGAEVEIPGEAAWLPFAEDATIGERVRVENLLTQRALDAEGAAMGHCVADYGWRCRYGLSRILSLKELCPEGSRHRLSTAEILVDAEGRVSVAQHRSHGNGSPPALAREALGTYLRDVAEGRVVSNVGALARMARERPSGGFGQGGHGGPGPLPLAELCDRLASHPWREPGAVETHWRAWGRLLEGPARKMTAVQWAATIPEEVLAAADAKGSAVGSALEEIRRGPDRDAQDMRLAA